jgi:thiamine-phosphate pyrophosphorylase
MASQLIQGLYAITPDEGDTDVLLQAVDETLGAGTRLLQYRNKAATPELRRAQLQALKPMCERHGCTLVVNDDWRLALALGLQAVHIGGEDGDAATVRAALGPSGTLGVSCYASLDRAKAVAEYADYLAFGSMYPSPSKPQAPSAALQVLQQAQGFGRPVVAIGGINLANARQVLEAGADAIAVISGVFLAPSIAGATQAFLETVASWKRESGTTGVR